MEKPLNQNYLSTDAQSHITPTPIPTKNKESKDEGSPNTLIINIRHNTVLVASETCEFNMDIL